MRPVLVVTVCAGALAVALSGCGTGGYTSEGSQGAGKELFQQRCGGCHTLADAGTNGNIGPDLDDAFAQAREVGMTSDTFTQVVASQIKFPVEHPVTGAPGMPGPDGPMGTLPSCDDVEGDAFCVEDQDGAIEDVATYVGAVAGTGITVEQPTDGKSIFTANCGSCHTLADAGTSGTVGTQPRRVTAAAGARRRPSDERPGRDAVLLGLARRAADPGGRRLRRRRRRPVARYSPASATRSTTTCVTGTS